MNENGNELLRAQPKLASEMTGDGTSFVVGESNVGEGTTNCGAGVGNAIGSSDKVIGTIDGTSDGRSDNAVIDGAPLCVVIGTVDGTSLIAIDDVSATGLWDGASLPDESTVFAL